MPQKEQITLYADRSPAFSHRVLIALEDAKAEYTFYEFTIWRGRPEWFNIKVNPLGKIPAIAYGGPKTPPDQPSPESAKLGESLALVEFVADIFPDSGLLPADPVLRARARMAYMYFETAFVPALGNFFFNGKPEARTELLNVMEQMQNLLPEFGFVVGNWSIADVIVAPFLVRLVVLLEHDLGRYSTDDGKKMLLALREPRFARIMQYIANAKEWPSFKTTYDETALLAHCRQSPFLVRNS